MENLLITLVIISLLNFCVSSLSLGITIFRDSSPRRGKKLNNKSKVIKGLKVFGIIVVAIGLLLVLDIVISVYV